MAKKRPQDNGHLELPVSYGGVSFGKKTARVGCTIDRGLLSLNKANEHFCDTRLSITIKANPQGDQPGQGRLAGMDDTLELKGSADVKGFGVHTGTISFGLTFNTAELRTSGIRFQDFAAREGSIVITEVGTIPEGESDEEGGDE